MYVLASHTGENMGENVCKIIPLYIKISNEVVSENKKDDDSFELIENCLNTINNLVMRCNKNSRDYSTDILTFAK